MVVKLSISISEELTAVLDELARRRGDDRSPLIETLLRENPLVKEGVALWRMEAWTRPAPPPPGGRDDSGPYMPGVEQAVLETLSKWEITVLNAVSKQSDGISTAELSRAVGLSHKTLRLALQALMQKRAITVREVGGTVRVYLPSPSSAAAAAPKSKEVPRGALPP